ncbi:GDP-mannose mannosyl hydrolase [Catenovulum sp. 2E275]|uniref:GDP-mannose mannosyl hydrolase n=1 Tax=Catenovulum sp. 2E275 TaxID=2980497 RepID=UPI0021D0D1F4|nr:GDP-mannose mannosyl hydrolase [Catenovulum sp. 2E275]MCU4675019.1 GDP-mannose mannosyl hydrolase [Catenovulum sp. 2E275]
MFLDKEVFKTVIANAPLISIDLIIENAQSEFLLGKRINKPAQNYWFVPGGRIYKGETLEAAFSRITKAELGNTIVFDKAVFEGIYQHFYDDSFVENSISTHYIVLAYKLKLNEVQLNNAQHESYHWFSLSEIKDSNLVHPYTKDYFTS